MQGSSQVPGAIPGRVCQGCGRSAQGQGGRCRSTDHSCRRDPPRLPALAKITCISELPTPPGTLKLPSDFLPMPESKSTPQCDDLSATLVANVPPDVKKLWWCLDPLQIDLLQGSGSACVLSQSPRTDNDEVMHGQPWVHQDVV